MSSKVYIHRISPPFQEYAPLLLRRSACDAFGDVIPYSLDSENLFQWPVITLLSLQELEKKINRQSDVPQVNARGKIITSHLNEFDAKIWMLERHYQLPTAVFIGKLHADGELKLALTIRLSWWGHDGYRTKDD